MGKARSTIGSIAQSTKPRDEVFSKKTLSQHCCWIQTIYSVVQFPSEKSIPAKWRALRKTYHNRKNSKPQKHSTLEKNKKPQESQTRKKRNLRSYTLGHKKSERGSSLVIQSLGLSAVTAMAGIQVLMGTKILQATQHKQKKKKKGK